ncbi:hypothetical protein ACFV0T_26415 [Streptomyces sp. NPDC059582]|uniref:hypothetical protein n=1 Tax=Streptomyces sp. NPDC059582 TaxID=3346875 RepID=UPI0036A3A45D
MLRTRLTILVSRIRTYLPALISSTLYILCGIAFGLTWWGITGRTDMPWWIALLLVAVAGWIADLAEQVIRYVRQRRARPGVARHRKAV